MRPSRTEMSCFRRLSISSFPAGTSRERSFICRHRSCHGAPSPAWQVMQIWSSLIQQQLHATVPFPCLSTMRSFCRAWANIREGICVTTGGASRPPDIPIGETFRQTIFKPYRASCEASRRFRPATWCSDRSTSSIPRRGRSYGACAAQTGDGSACSQAGAKEIKSRWFRK